MASEPLPNQELSPKSLKQQLLEEVMREVKQSQEQQSQELKQQLLEEVMREVKQSLDRKLEISTSKLKEEVSTFRVRVAMVENREVARCVLQDVKDFGNKIFEVPRVSSRK